ncbi:MAG: hypothetical protein ACFFCW_44345 [Candidatus Hodarchaeota archaeon]
MNPDPVVRRESIERLWDCWERIKTLERPNDKKASITLLLNKAATQADVRAMLEEQARKLTDIGNSFHIRQTGGRPGDPIRLRNRVKADQPHRNGPAGAHGH